MTSAGLMAFVGWSLVGIGHFDLNLIPHTLTELALFTSGASIGGLAGYLGRNA